MADRDAVVEPEQIERALDRHARRASRRRRNPAPGSPRRRHGRGTAPAARPAPRARCARCRRPRAAARPPGHARSAAPCPPRPLPRAIAVIAAAYCGAMRIAPSRRITSPFSIGFSRMWRTRAAYSSGRPRRLGNGTAAPSDCWTFSGRPFEHRRREDAGRDRDHADAVAGELARRRQRQRRDAALGGGIGRLADLALEGGDRGGVDDHPALAAGVRARAPPSRRPRGASG